MQATVCVRATVQVHIFWELFLKLIWRYISSLLLKEVVQILLTIHGCAILLFLKLTLVLFNSQLSQADRKLTQLKSGNFSVCLVTWISSLTWDEYQSQHKGKRDCTVRTRRESRCPLSRQKLPVNLNFLMKFHPTFCEFKNNYRFLFYCFQWRSFFSHSVSEDLQSCYRQRKKKKN